ncbi:MAG: response regulator [Deltaproteobacteria bacterium]|nr:response regulator [Deltaproteobacteria bacterium]MBN2688774.1 response regulator [Deltaproteobacteria bacterium]
MVDKRILLVDDEEAIIRVLTVSLKSDGYDVIPAYSGNEGLALYEQHMPPIVLTDIKMPGMDGLELLKRIKNANPDAEVIVITGHGDMDSAIEALRFGASDFINKPVRDEALSIALKRAHEKLEMKNQLRRYTNDLEHMCQIATEEVRRKSDFQDKLITSSNDAIVATDENGMIVTFNPGAEEIFGYSRLEVVRKMKFDDLYPEEIAEEFISGFRRKRDMKGGGWKEVIIINKNGKKVPVRFSGTLLYEKDSVIGSVGFFQDLREIKRLQQELVNSERLAAIGQTVARLAHYIKNILTGLKGGTYIVNIGLDKNDTDKLRTGWSMVQRNIGRISYLVMDLLTYSKEREPDYRDCYPNDIAEDVCELMEAKATENQIRLIRAFDPAIGELCMDPDAIHRCLLNFVSNAIDACLFDLELDKKWQVCVKTELFDDSAVKFVVSDNGGGMTDEVKGKLFTAFFSTKGGKGTGLGLLVTQKLVYEHGGKIDVTSEPGKGSTFTMTLPFRKKNADTAKH